MAEKLADLEKDKDKAAKLFDTAQDALEKVAKKWTAEKDPGKQLDLLRQMTPLLHKAIKAGEDADAAGADLAKAAKAAGKS